MSEVLRLLAFATFALGLLPSIAGAQPCAALDSNYAVTATPPVFTSILGGPGAETVFTQGADNLMYAETIGFPFSFFGLPKTSVVLSSNGFVAFDTFLGWFGFGANPILPSPAVPDDFVAPWWDDLFHAAPASITAWALLGPPGNRRFVAEWSGLERAPGNASGENVHFQLVLNEAGGTIEFHYDGATFATGGDPWNATIGAESEAAIRGVDATGGGNTNATFPATDLLLSPVPAPPVTFPSYAVTPLPYAFPGIVGTPGAVTVFTAPVDELVSAATPIGFPFSFFHAPKTTFRVSSNGFVAFDDPSAGTYPENVIPGSPGDPDDFAAPWWDNLVHDLPSSQTAYLVSGPPGARTLTVEWVDLQRGPTGVFGGNVHFAALFREGSNVVEFHYDPLSFAPAGFPFQWNASVGIENADGGLGVDLVGTAPYSLTLPPTDFVLDPCDCGVEAAFGAGCPTSLGQVAAIGSAGGSPSAPNPTYAITLANAPPGATALLIFGASSASWAGLPLPLSLAGFGGSAACTLLASVDFVVSVTAGGTGTAAVPLPLAAPVFCAGTVYTQWAVLDFGLPGLPVATSGGLAVSL